MYIKSVLLFLVLLLFRVFENYKILILNPKFGYSHVNFLSQIADTLVDAGHNVTVLSMEIDPSINHPGSYKANIIRYPGTKQLEDHFRSLINPEFFWSLNNTGSDQLKMVERFMNTFYDYSLKIFNDNELIKNIKKERFDVGIAEAISPFLFGMLKVCSVKTNVAAFSMPLSDQNYKDFGLDFPTSYIPTSMSPFTDKMSYMERTQNLGVYLMSRYFHHLYGYKPSLQDEFDNKYGKGYYDRDKIIGNSAFIFLNSHPFIDIPGPKTPKMVEISGIGIKDTKPLDNYWDKILSLSPNTVLISFGTIAKSSFMPENLKNGLLETIKRLPNITFIWKYESPEDGTGEGIENLILSKWFPQSDLLNDKRLTLFITHGGAGSVTEAFFRGVPVVAIPILNDQYKNVKLFERHGTGLLMDKNDLSNYSILEKKIKEVIGNKEYKEKAEVMAKMLKKRPIQPKELLIKHIEFAAEFGSLEVLDLASRNMSFIEYYNLDIIVPFLVILLSVISVLFYVLYKFIRSIFYSKVKKD
uniref:UDP-glucuronosyltransferase n=1 Tax=Parastrongyloides trichosuri TaxID=131310 RepID=A0A0N5A5S9_PARTI